MAAPEPPTTATLVPLNLVSRVRILGGFVASPPALAYACLCGSALSAWVVVSRPLIGIAASIVTVQLCLGSPEFFRRSAMGFYRGFFAFEPHIQVFGRDAVA
jgi:hypothetical protein